MQIQSNYSMSKVQYNQSIKRQNNAKYSTNSFDKLAFKAGYPPIIQYPEIINEGRAIAKSFAEKKVINRDRVNIFARYLKHNLGSASDREKHINEFMEIFSPHPELLKEIYNTNVAPFAGETESFLYNIYDHDQVCFPGEESNCTLGELLKPLKDNQDLLDEVLFSKAHNDCTILDEVSAKVLTTVIPNIKSQELSEKVVSNIRVETLMRLYATPQNGEFLGRALQNRPDITEKLNTREGRAELYKHPLKKIDYFKSFDYMMDGLDRL